MSIFTIWSENALMIKCKAVFKFYCDELLDIEAVDHRSFI